MCNRGDGGRISFPPFFADVFLGVVFLITYHVFVVSEGVLSSPDAFWSSEMSWKGVVEFLELTREKISQHDMEFRDSFHHHFESLRRSGSICAGGAGGKEWLKFLTSPGKCAVRTFLLMNIFCTLEYEDVSVAESELVAPLLKAMGSDGLFSQSDGRMIAAMLFGLTDDKVSHALDVWVFRLPPPLFSVVEAYGLLLFSLCAFAECPGDEGISIFLHGSRAFRT